MFGNNLSDSKVSNPQQNSAMSPEPSGISTAVKELITEVDENTNLNIRMQEVLGIAFHATGQSEKPAAPSVSLVQILRDQIYRLREANHQLNTVINHINS